jgi:ATP-dependent Clp protease ATP-binding subunit ClpC
LKDFGTGVGFSTSAKVSQANDYAKSVIQNALKKTFAPEFLNRIDDVVLFNTLTKEDISKIIDIELKGLYDRIHQLGYNIQFTEDARNFIIEKGYDIQFGARPLKRAIQKYVEDPLAEAIIKSSIKEGDIICIGFDTEKQEINITVQPHIAEVSPQ